MTLYRGKYRIESVRLRGWDYTQNGSYFVTVCCKERASFLGNIVDGVINLSPIGEIVAEEWKKSAQIRPNVALDAWVIMPNHVHGILILQNDPVETARRSVSTETRRAVSAKGLSSNSLGSIIGQFKSVCTKRIWKQGVRNFGWQARFYDRIIRNEDALLKARNYIMNNPAKWELDKNNPANLFM